MDSVSKGKWNKVTYFDSILENLLTYIDYIHTSD